MKQQAFQPGELRDEHDNIIRAGAYGKKTPFVNSDNSAILDYIMNNFDALYAQIPNGRAYVKSVNNITPDSNGNVTVNVGSGGGTGGNITVDSALSSTSTNPVQNKVLYAALNNKLDKNGTATYAARDSSGNIISISSSGGGSNITVDSTLSGTSSNAIANKAVYAALDNKLDKTGTAAAATKATQDSYGNVIVNTYARKSDLSGYVKTINNMEPDTNGNINISTGGGGTGTSITVDTTLSSTSNNPIANKAVYTAVNNKLDKNGTAMYASRDSSGNVFSSTYATKTELSKCVKSINNLTPDSSGNVNISVTGGGTSITVDTELSNTSTNPVQNKVIYNALLNKVGTDIYSGFALIGATSTIAWHQGSQVAGSINASSYTGNAASATKATQDGAGNVITDTYAKKTDVSGMVKSVNNTKPDSNGNVTITVSGGGSGSDGGVSLSAQNTWTAQQTFDTALLEREKYTTMYGSGTSVTPIQATAVYTATGNFTLDLTTTAYLLASGQSQIITVYIKSSADYALTLKGAGTVKYIGAASDLAITSAGLLLNILMMSDGSGGITSIVQASKLS